MDEAAVQCAHPAQDRAPLPRRPYAARGRTLHCSLVHACSGPAPFSKPPQVPLPREPALSLGPPRQASPVSRTATPRQRANCRPPLKHHRDSLQSPCSWAQVQQLTRVKRLLHSLHAIVAVSPHAWGHGTDNAESAAAWSSGVTGDTQP